MAETSSAPHSTLTLKQRLVRCAVGLAITAALILYAGLQGQQKKSSANEVKTESHQH